MQKKEEAESEYSGEEFEEEESLGFNDRASPDSKQNTLETKKSTKKAAELSPPINKQPSQKTATFGKNASLTKPREPAIQAKSPQPVAAKQEQPAEPPKKEATFRKPLPRYTPERRGSPQPQASKPELSKPKVNVSGGGGGDDSAIATHKTEKTLVPFHINLE